MLVGVIELVNSMEINGNHILGEIHCYWIEYSLLRIQITCYSMSMGFY